MQTALKKKYLGVLRKRIAHLTNRITNAKKDLSWDRLEKAALIYAVELVVRELTKPKKEIIESKPISNQELNKAVQQDRER
jgi:hypothetical protein